MAARQETLELSEEEEEQEEGTLHQELDALTEALKAEVSSLGQQFHTFWRHTASTVCECSRNIQGKDDVCPGLATLPVLRDVCSAYMILASG